MEYDINTIIIGAGQIGSLYDSDESNYQLTWGKGLKKHSLFSLVGFVDKNLTLARQAASKWECDHFSSIDEATNETNIDLAVVCTPDETHFIVFKKLVSLGIKNIICEKPISLKTNEVKEIINIAQESKTLLFVNYMRRFIPEFIKLKSDIEKCKFGKFVSANCYYTGMFIHNATHFLDLLHFLVGLPKEVDVIIMNKIKNHDDAYLDITLFTEYGKVVFQNVASTQFSLFECDLLFSHSRIRIINSGFQIIIEKCASSKVFSEVNFTVTDEIIDTSLGQYIHHSLNAFINVKKLGQNEKHLNELRYMHKLIDNWVN